MKKIVLYVLFLLFVSSILFGTTTITASHNALYLWATTLVPSFLFPLIFVRLLTPYHLLYPFLKPLNPLFLFLFKIDAKAMETILTALLLGFPSATMYLDEIAKTNHLTKQQYQRFINIIFLASPNFILLSLSVLYPINILYQLLTIQLLCIFIMLLCTRKTPITFSFAKQDVAFFKQLSLAITQSFQILFLILAYLLISYVCIDLLSYLLIDNIKTPITLLSEFSSGCFYLAHMSINTKMKYILTSVLLAYGGLCVHLQIINSVDQSKFQYSSFLKFRLLHILLAFLLSYFIFS